MGKHSREVIRELRADGWVHVATTGSHYHFKHPIKPGKVTYRIRARTCVRRLAVDLSSGEAWEGLNGMASFVAFVHRDDGTSYGVSFPDVPGCISAGDTLEEALANASEALGGHFSLLKADGEALPTPRSLEAIKSAPELSDKLEGAVLCTVAPALGVRTRRFGLPQHVS